MWADVICNWDGLADDFSRTCTVPKVGRIWELTFESLATRKTRICFRVCGYLESKLRLISNNVTLLKQPQLPPKNGTFPMGFPGT